MTAGTFAERPATTRLPAALAVLSGLCARAACVRSAVVPALDAWQIEVVAALLRGPPV